MFEIITLDDAINLQACYLNQDYAKKLEEVIREKYEFKIIRGRGICFKILDIVAQSGHLYEGDAIFEVKLKMLNLYLLKDELHYGVIINQMPLQIQLHHLTIHVDKLINQSIEEGVFVTTYEGVKFYYELGAEVKFKIQEIKWDIEFQIIGRMDEVGLGGINWWK